MSLLEDGLVFIEVEDLHINVESIVAIRATDSGGSRLYCEDAHTFLVGVPPREIVDQIREAVEGFGSSASPAPPPGPYTQWTQYPTVPGATFTTNGPIVSAPNPKSGGTP